jgi:CubicO group peptidase (beta-lactamase class C family)
VVLFYIKSVVATVVAWAVWIVFVGFSTLNGWWHSPVAATADTRAFFEAAVNIVASENVGNVALVLIEDGKVYEEYFNSVSQEIDRDTLFPAASMSKWIAALGVMNLVQAGDIDLDVPISTYLTRWQLPPSEFDHDGVTVRSLLSHMSGLADGLGFGDYEPDEVLPSLEASLQHPRASSGLDVQIALGRAPGSEWDYSGGGYLILQLIIEEVSGRSFADYMQAVLFQPLAMSRSTYGYIGSFQNRSNSYDESGQQATLYQYAASAATGFSTSVADMIRLVQAQLADPSPANFLRRDTLAQMREPNATYYGFDIWGLGTILYAQAESGDFVYGHDGQNEPAINSAVRINPDSGDAIIVFASGNKSLATLLGFEWVFWQTGVPDFLGFGYVIKEGMRILIIGAIVILVLAIFSTWWLRRRRYSSLY